MADDDIYNKLNQNAVDVAVLKEWRAAIDKKLGELDKTLDTFVTRIEFTVVKLIVFGTAGTFLSAVLVALASKVITKT